MAEKSMVFVPQCRFATEAAEDEFLCHCNEVTESTVASAVQAGSASCVQTAMSETGAGTGCGACRCRIQRVVDGLPAKCGGRFDFCHTCGCASAICDCEVA